MDIETEVKNFYDNNYDKFNSTRYSVWNEVKKFIDTIPDNSKVLDVGCGNGKNMTYIKNKSINVIGVDFSEKLLEICEKKLLNVVKADVRNLPFDDDTFDYVISIAVIHHLSTEKYRQKSINEMLRVCKSNGKVLISTWAFEQPDMSKFNFIPGDNNVKWNITKRYYYIYDRENIVKFLEPYNVESLLLDKGNYFINLLK